MNVPAKMRQFFSPTIWMIKLLRLDEEKARPEAPGLIMVQIDGLAAHHMNKAARLGLLPFLKKLQRQGGYALWPHYSGIPSNTPSVQGEIFYGIKQLVPAFHFKDNDTRQVFKMYESSSASKKEAEGLEKTEAPLLENGSSYGNIFAGGAKESHYTASTFGKDEIRRALKPRVVVTVLLFNLHIFARAFILTLIELYLAVYDFFRGVSSGYNFASELHFIPTRVGVSVLLRELITAGAKIDIARGLPVIHLNLFGYDEQAHRRGPSSWFAYWSLKGIDSAIRRVAEAAWKSTKREYEIMIYSDHGQEDCTPYPRVMGRNVDEAVQEVFCSVLRKGKGKYKIDYYKQACACPSPSRVKKIKSKDMPDACAAAPDERLIVTAMGPIGFIYPPFALSDMEIAELAPRLVKEAKIPVLIAKKEGRFRIWTDEGEDDLDSGLRKVLGDDHPYPSQVISDVTRLCGHPDAGPFVFFGWQAGKVSLTFPDEHGAHGGIGPTETKGFALLPPAMSTLEAKNYLTPTDLRNVSLIYLNRAPEPDSGEARFDEMPGREFADTRGTRAEKRKARRAASNR